MRQPMEKSPWYVRIEALSGSSECNPTGKIAMSILGILPKSSRAQNEQMYDCIFVVSCILNDLAQKTARSIVNSACYGPMCAPLREMCGGLLRAVISPHRSALQLPNDCR